jgi:hypothetical protein
MSALFPKRDWLFWEGNSTEDEDKVKKDNIQGYMSKHVLEHPGFKKEAAKVVQDYVDTGNCFAMPVWTDERVEVISATGAKTQQGYVGPSLKRISPLDIVFNPIADDFMHSPKIIRSIMTIGEARREIEAISTDMNRDDLTALWTYITSVRTNVHNASTGGFDFIEKDAYLAVDGFTNYQQYLQSDYVEFLTFYGDLYDLQDNRFYRNHVITIIDRHKVLSNVPQPSYFGYPPIYHTGWRTRQDNLWAMGPLDNLVGMQYRIDHLENLKADVFDLITFPPLKIRGYVEDFEWQPMERIIMDADGDVEMLVPDFNVLNANTEISLLEEKMEIMAGAPKEAMGFRNPGEKTMYEVQRIENAYTRIFQQKIAQAEEQVFEPAYNGMLELAWRKMPRTSVRSFNNDFDVATFSSLTAEDITGVGRIRPLAARHFGEKAEILQNLTNLANTPIGQDPNVTIHFSGLKTAQMLEEFLGIEDYEIVQPYVRVSEQADAQRLMNSAQESVGVEAMTPAGIAEDDVGV